MNRTLRLILILLLALALPATALAAAPAQNPGQPQSVWVTSNMAAVGANQTLRVSINANSATPIQGLSFSLRYDPACLAVQGSQIVLDGLSNMSMKQPAGMVEGIYTSTSPLQANGELVAITFSGLKPCETQLALEAASLMMLDENRMAVVQDGIGISGALLPVSIVAAAVNPAGAQSIAVLDDPNASLDETSANPVNPGQVAEPTAQPAQTNQEQPAPGEQDPAQQTLVSAATAWGSILAISVLLLLVLWGAWGLLRHLLAKKRQAQAATAMPAAATPVLTAPVRAHAGVMDSLRAPARQTAATPEANPAPANLPAGSAYLTIQRGIQAGTRARLASFPCSLGNSPANDVKLEDPSIAPFHAKIYLDKGAYTLVDLGSAVGTFVNGRFYQNQLVPLQPGDVVKIGSIILTFSLQ